MAEPVTVDLTDYRILRLILQGDADTFRSDRVNLDAVAKAVGLHRNTVAGRVKRLTEGDVLLPACLEVEPALFGLVGALVSFDSDPALRGAALRDTVFAFPGAQTVMHLLDGCVVIVFAPTEDDLRALVRDMKTAVGASTAFFEVLTTRDYPPPEPVTLSPLDIRLLCALLRDMRAPFRDLAKRLDVSAVHVKRRYERLAAHDVIYLYPTGTAPVQGVVQAWVRVDIPDETQKPDVVAAVDRLMPDYWVRNSATVGAITGLNVAASLHGLDEQAQAVRDVPGVAAVVTRPLSHVDRNPDYAAWLEARILACDPRAAKSEAP